MKKPTRIAKARIVYDRLHRATRKVPATVYIEVMYERRRTLYNTGVRVCKDQFRNGLVVNCDGRLAASYNSRVSSMLAAINDYITDRLRAGEEFSLAALKRHMEGREAGGDGSFLGFMLRRMGERRMSEATRRGHMSVYRTLSRWGVIRRFSDLTEGNISLWDELSRKNAVKTARVWSYHKVLKIYIRDAVRFGLAARNPYDSVEVRRDSPHGHRFLTAGELDAIRSLGGLEPCLERARDMFLFQCYTSLSYTDMRGFNAGELLEVDGKPRLRGKRAKTGEEYYITLLAPARAIVEKYGGKLPAQSIQVYNRHLHVLQLRAGIRTHLTSHVGRHTFATTVALRNGVPMEVLSRMMGHTSVKTTQIYAKVLQASVDEQFDRLDGIIS